MHRESRAYRDIESSTFVHGNGAFPVDILILVHLETEMRSLMIFLRLVVVFSSLVFASAMNADNWQLSQSYPPDKTHLWTYGIDMDGWTLAHDALRGEIKDFQHALDTIMEQDISRRQVRAMRKWWKGHLTHVQSHHTNEDNIVKAFVKRRFSYPEFMQDDHEEIEHHFRVISDVIRQVYIARNDHDRMEALVKLKKAFEEYSDCLLPHLLAEEAIGIPLTRAYFTPKEVQRLTIRLARSGPRCETGSIVHYVGPAKLRQAMRLQNAPLQRIAWILILNPRHRYYKRHMLRLLNDILVESPKKYCGPFGAVHIVLYLCTHYIRT